MQRNQSDRLVANPAVLRAVGAPTVEAHTAAMLERMHQVEREMLREFPVPMLRVDTTDGYDPGLDAILAFAAAPHVAPPS